MKMDPLALAAPGIRGRVINWSDCCVLVSENAPTTGQQQTQVKPDRSSWSRDVDRIKFDDGSAAARLLVEGFFNINRCYHPGTGQ
jgi:predicted acyl esterase